MRRAEEMAAGLGRPRHLGGAGSALAYAGNVDLVSRTHFARWLVATGHCADVREVFTSTSCRKRDTFRTLARLSDAIAWINGAGGVAVVAHPGRYKFSETEAWALFSEFKEAGGTAIESRRRITPPTR